MSPPVEVHQGRCGGRAVCVCGGGRGGGQVMHCKNQGNSECLFLAIVHCITMQVAEHGLSEQTSQPCNLATICLARAPISDHFARALP